MSLFSYSLAFLCMEHLRFWGGYWRANFRDYGGGGSSQPLKPSLVIIGIIVLQLVYPCTHGLNNFHEFPSSVLTFLNLTL